MKKLIGFGIATGLAALLATGVSAETRITYKSAKSGSSYYQMGVEIAEALKKKTDGDIVVTVEESQGSVQNVMEVRARGADYVFTTPPALVSAAQKAAGPFDGKGDPKFADIRALFPIPSLTMHFVMSDKSGVTDFAGMEGKTILLGKGSFGAREGEIGHLQFLSYMFVPLSVGMFPHLFQHWLTAKSAKTFRLSVQCTLVHEACKDLLLQAELLSLREGDALTCLGLDRVEFLLHRAEIIVHVDLFAVDLANGLHSTAEVGDAEAAKAKDQHAHQDPNQCFGEGILYGHQCSL